MKMKIEKVAKTRRIKRGAKDQLDGQRAEGEERRITGIKIKKR